MITSWLESQTNEWAQSTSLFATLQNITCNGDYKVVQASKLFKKWVGRCYQCFLFICFLSLYFLSQSNNSNKKKQCRQNKHNKIDRKMINLQFHFYHGSGFSGVAVFYNSLSCIIFISSSVKAIKVIGLFPCLFRLRS